MKNLTPSQVHYIKAVYELSSGSRGVRVMDIAEKLGVSKASTSLSMTKLAQQGFVYKDAERHVYLTKEGERQAVQMLNKNEIIQKFLMGVLGVDKEVAIHDACGMEHSISTDTLCAICRLCSNMGANMLLSSRCPALPEKQICNPNI